MKCPMCINENLVMSERQGVEIDYCPTCRGVWLDRGELDKIIEKATAAEKSVPSFSPPPPTYKDYKHHEKQDYYKHKRKNWLEELFD